MLTRTWRTRTRISALVRASLAGAALITLAACDAPPIAWDAPVAIARVAPPSHLVVDSAGHAAFVADTLRVASLPAVAAGAARCAASVQTAAGATRVFAAWWAVRPDSSAGLYAAWSTDGGRSWAPPIAVDTTDISSRGCSRPPPSLTAVDDDIYIAYSMVAPEGNGAFRERFGREPGPYAAIGYEAMRSVLEAISAAGDRVAVAYEDPNGRRQEVEVAFSVTQGHIFEVHTPASRGVDVATSPDVAFAGDAIAVSWVEHRFGSDSTTTVVRVGRLSP